MAKKPKSPLKRRPAKLNKQRMLEAYERQRKELEELQKEKKRLDKLRNARNRELKLRVTVCPISCKQFMLHANDLPITIGGEGRLLVKHRKKTGSFGWYLNDKLLIDVGGVELKLQVGVNVTVIGSKDAPEE